MHVVDSKITIKYSAQAERMEVYDHGRYYKGYDDRRSAENQSGYRAGTHGDRYALSRMPFRTGGDVGGGGYGARHCGR